MQEIQRKTTLVKKLSNNNYLISIDSKELKIHTETIVKYNLLSSDNNYTYDEIKELDSNMRALLAVDKYFIKYPKSIKEAINIIVNKYKISDYEAIINRLIKLNILNDNRLKLSIIENLEYKLYGPIYICNYLYIRGLDNNYNRSYSNSELVTIFDKLLKNRTNKIDKNYRYLLNRGYKIEDIKNYFNDKK